MKPKANVVVLTGPWLDSEEGFVIQEPEQTVCTHAKFLLNTSASAEDDKCVWEGITVAPVIPALMPQMARLHNSVLKAIHIEPLPKAAVRNGVYMDASTVKGVCSANKIFPTEGSGKPNKNGKRNMVKIDWVKALVAHFFPLASEKDAELMVLGIMGVTKLTERCPDEVVDGLSFLLPGEDGPFRELKQHAMSMKAEYQRHVEQNAPAQFSGFD